MPPSFCEAATYVASYTLMFLVVAMLIVSSAMVLAGIMVRSS